jgi:hypothetical protein
MVMIKRVYVTWATIFFGHTRFAILDTYVQPFVRKKIKRNPERLRTCTYFAVLVFFHVGGVHRWHYSMF